MRQRKRSINSLAIAIFVGMLIIFGATRNFLTPTYRPSSPAIEQLAMATTMTPKAQQLFYGQDPKIEPKAQFHQLCRRSGRAAEARIILGCYTNDGYRGQIVIQSVTDPRLQGTMEVVAAHEMLHAAYQNLSLFERDRLAPKLKQAARRVQDPLLAGILADYAKGDPAIYLNELHSHLGSELGNLDNPDLERHYQQYFRDRQRVVAFARQSSQTLSQLDTEADLLVQEIDRLEADLKATKADLQRSAEALDASQDRLNTLKADLNRLKSETELALAQGDPSLISQFEQARVNLNEAVVRHNDNVRSHQAQVAAFNQEVDTYQNKVAAYNQLARERRSILQPLQADQPEESANPSEP
ncbi:hypothetical protein [Lyngbya confervoides]|uniref:Chromosome partition protein Smc n=1 Tax=Lyngbya confervoides BDU141951 TaxID=1574623 RepID=A0ABD4T440_9CYAN|nr:hypothetical protein [Lyngbya confervoides]MCM1983205.1 hypothetical protein [Lyngbya confervoides BDU141951]